MGEPSIPPDIRDFINRHIDSVAQLEALLMMRSSPDTVWDVAAASKRLYVSQQEAGDTLDRLCANGLLTCKDGNYRYECAPELRATVDELALAYSRLLIPITNLIHAKPRRIREFADAFKFRKER